jgi:hypothetical protein
LCSIAVVAMPLVAVCFIFPLTWASPHTRITCSPHGTNLSLPFDPLHASKLRLLVRQFSVSPSLVLLILFLLFPFSSFSSLFSLFFFFFFSVSLYYPPPGSLCVAMCLCLSVSAICSCGLE